MLTGHTRCARRSLMNSTQARAWQARHLRHRAIWRSNETTTSIWASPQQFDDVFTSGDTVRASIGGFYNHVTNPITRRFGSANLARVNNVPFYWNTPSYKIYGLEFSTSYDSEYVFGNLGLSWMNGSRHGAINDVYGPDTYAMIFRRLRRRRNLATKFRIGICH